MHLIRTALGSNSVVRDITLSWLFSSVEFTLIKLLRFCLDGSKFWNDYTEVGEKYANLAIGEGTILLRYNYYICELCLCFQMPMLIITIYKSDYIEKS